MAPLEEDNARRHREALEAFNRRDLDAIVSYYDEECVVTDHAQQQTMKSTDGVRAWNQAWLDGFSDAMLEITECLSAADSTVARFTGRGTNDGRMASFEPTNRRVQLELCDVARWRDGKIVEEHIYYDMYGMLAQLGHVPPMAPTG